MKKFIVLVNESETEFRVIETEIKEKEYDPFYMENKFHVNIFGKETTIWEHRIFSTKESAELWGKTFLSEIEKAKQKWAYMY